MDELNREWQNEQERVDIVVKKIADKTRALEQHIGKVKSDIVHIRKNFWDDVTINLDDAHEAAETHASIKQQAEMLSERERSHRHSHNQLKTLQRLQQSPYFGRIDFREKDEREADSIYLGIGSFFDEETEQFLIYDWRAPISSLYYDYSVGLAQYEAPSGTVEGEMKTKRQFIIRNGKIISMFDTGVTIGDTLLQEVLGNRANTQMKNIVATIQKEQNRIIRNEKSRLLIVQGAAGSGKTSAALQRIAYLVYRYRESLRADQIILFSPNQMFNSYVSTVLPELGEENMQQTTFQEYLEHQLGDEFELEDPFVQMEYVLTSRNQQGYQSRIAGIQCKSSIDFMTLIDRYALYLKYDKMIFKDIKFRGRVLIASEQIKEKFYSLDASMSIPNRMQYITEWLLAELKRHEKLERKKSWVEQEMEILDKDTFVAVHEQLQRKKRYAENTFDDFERERKALAALVVRKHFMPLRKYVKKLRFINIPAIYQQLFADPQFAASFKGNLPQEWEEICRQTANKIEHSYLPYEDTTPYLYLKEQLEGFQKNTSIRHVFIDEAQDYSPFQFAFLKRLFPFGKMTILGDLNQAIHAQSVNTNLFSLASLYEPEQTETIELKRSYRSTRQIIEFTRQLIPGGEEVEPFNREGHKPVMIKVSEKAHMNSVENRIQSLQKAGQKTIAIICKTAQESKEAYTRLHEKMELRLITKETSSFEPGVLILPSYLAKGVEFDAVILYNAAQYKEENERKLFYTSCTRAMHDLYIYSIGEVSPFLTEVLLDSYTIENE
jgi:DNA helicase-2/ATP-dependent DNA helicase PcrA